MAKALGKPQAFFSYYESGVRSIWPSRSTSPFHRPGHTLQLLYGGTGAIDVLIVVITAEGD
jgi:hypothetical protein